MTQSLLEMAKDLTQALIQAGKLTSTADVDRVLQATYHDLVALNHDEARGLIATEVATPVPVDWRKSITKYHVTCLECGQRFRQLPGRHLSEHGLDARAYRAKYGIPRRHPLTCKATSQRRREVLRATRPWEHSPKWLESHAPAPAKKGRRTRAKTAVA